MLGTRVWDGVRGLRVKWVAGRNRSCWQAAPLSPEEEDDGKNLHPTCGPSLLP